MMLDAISCKKSLISMQFSHDYGLTFIPIHLQALIFNETPEIYLPKALYAMVSSFGWPFKDELDR